MGIGAFGRIKEEIDYGVAEEERVLKTLRRKLPKKKVCPGR